MAEQILQVTGRRWKWIPWFKHTIFITFSEKVTWQEVEWMAQGMAADGFQVFVLKPDNSLDALDS